MALHLLSKLPLPKHCLPESEASREVANLTERKNPHAPVYGVKEFVCLSVTKFKPNYHILLKDKPCQFTKCQEYLVVIYQFKIYYNFVLQI